MKRTLILMTLILVLGLSVAVQAQRESSGWEYANIQFDSFGVWFWKAPAVYAEGEELDDLCRELSIIIPGNENPDLYTLVKWAGGNGWELVSMDQRVSFISVWFKRKN
ncbi:MAG: hypothetical protein FVQ82_01925 [Planctomycetes bacterium]|nr:hypothetical protein [Planctomycetota bacterium]